MQKRLVVKNAVQENAWRRAACRALAALAALMSIQGAQAAPVFPGGVEIRRTTDGVPHVLASDWRGLGYGYGYVQAQDALCTMAEAFITFEGRRAAFFGADGRPAINSTFGRPANSELDFFFRAHAGPAMVNAARAAQPEPLSQMVAGFADGYNRYLAEARAGAADADAAAPAAACLKQPWVRAISADDIYRRMYAASIAGGYARFIAEIANAQPAQAVAGAAGRGAEGGLAALLAPRVGGEVGLGSNVIALGQRASGGDGAVLFGNPHWYWGGPDRFYQAQLTIPGKVNVAGVSFLGIPVIMLGFNDHIAWSHTVSDARRFGLFELSLTPGLPTSYRYEGRDEPMEQTSVAIEVLGADGVLREQRRTLYRSRFGPLIDLGQQNAAFGWSAQRALAVRDVNADNFRIFRNFFYWAEARSLDDFIAIQRREAALPWINTVAIGRDDGRVWFSDIGNVPNVPDQLRAACTTELGQAFAGFDAAVPFLDGSRAACGWRVDPRAAQPGAMATADMPGLLRDDYVANMNDSYWLSNPAQPLEGYPRTMGGERRALSLRGRYGHLLAQSLLQAGARSSLALSRRAMDAVLEPRSHAAELFKNGLLDGACNEAGAAPVDGLTDACAVLRNWDNRAATDAPGPLLWGAFWRRVDKIPDAALYRTPFDAAAPLTTPSAVNGADPRVRQALVDALGDLRGKGWAIDAPLGDVQFVRAGGRHAGVFGGCSAAGYFTIACARGPDGSLDALAEGNSYLQMVRFGPDGVDARTMLAHGEDERALAGGPGAAPLLRYARKEWLAFPFSEAAIASDPQLTRRVLLP
ncbi:penicillin acylase family protein [Janthinobacterium agaricidamnosum]|uniref:Penicillin amidase family protein n=1 Tax=Janthinobacterium agaricidamnosum NBRC 102515 = DSM 9628 TaxID=1349767 RepID=W0V439_9BURK|nr:penicillin acylase family protein [Janthinobacterium agaricidamnosum]CDG82370.1 penicillin amidase family protein [Janthinobacterium agaricidamnosum NBRC 102515 = DSM 9628]